MNKYDQYPFERITPDGLSYKFISIGPKGEIEMCIRFVRTNKFNTYNLVLGKLNDDNTIDDEIEINNEDRDKILMTVAAVVFQFTLVNQLSYITYCGSTSARTRLYRMALTINLCYLSQQFDIWGIYENGKYELFQANKDYSVFLIRRKL